MTGTPADPAELLDRLKSWLDLLHERQLVNEPEEKGLREMLVRSWGERLDLPGDPLLVAMLCGPTAVGKSSLINALAGAEISRPGLGAATSAGVVYVHEEDDPSRLFEYSEALGQLGREAASLVRHDRDELLHKVLVDTPDIDSVVQRHGEDYPRAGALRRSRSFCDVAGEVQGYAFGPLGGRAAPAARHCLCLEQVGPRLIRPPVRSQASGRAGFSGIARPRRLRQSAPFQDLLASVAARGLSGERAAGVAALAGRGARPIGGDGDSGAAAARGMGPAQCARCSGRAAGAGRAPAGHRSTRAAAADSAAGTPDGKK